MGDGAAVIDLAEWKAKRQAREKLANSILASTTAVFLERQINEIMSRDHFPPQHASFPCMPLDDAAFRNPKP